MKRLLAFSPLLLLLAVPAPTAAAASAPASVVDNDGRHDFDFFIGSWTIKNRLRKPSGKDEWLEFTSTTVDRSFLAGLGNMDEMTLPKERTGASLRFFDPVTKKWSIYWATSSRGQLEAPPVVGGFANGVGLFYADDVDAENKPLKSRFTWSNITAKSAHWDQAISYDGGQTWSVTWSMEFSRN